MRALVAHITTTATPLTRKPPSLCRRRPCLCAHVRSYSPHITEVKVVERRKVRRAKLYYLRERTAKEIRT